MSLCVHAYGLLAVHYSYAEVSNIILFIILIILWLTPDPGFTDGWGSLFKDK